MFADKSEAEIKAPEVVYVQDPKIVATVDTLKHTVQTLESKLHVAGEHTHTHMYI